MHAAQQISFTLEPSSCTLALQVPSFLPHPSTHDRIEQPTTTVLSSQPEVC